MGKSVIKDLLREIKKTFGRFFAIFAIVAIGVAFFAGVTASSGDMKNSTDAYYDEYNMSDLRLLSSIGFNEDDVLVLYKNKSAKEAKKLGISKEEVKKMIDKIED